MRPSASVAASRIPADKPVNGCYAAPLGDCGGKLSSEHFLSENLLHRINSGAPVHVRGPAWGGGKWLPLASLGSNILCERHNGALSVFDANMGRFADAIIRLGNEMARQDGTAWIHAVHGRDVERWLLKLLSGVCAGGHAAAASGERFQREVPERWLRILFGLEEMPPSWGLYVSASVGTPLFCAGVRDVAAAPISLSGRVVGVHADVFGWRLMLAMTLVQPEFARGGFDADSLYRPALLQVPTSSGAKRLYLHWEPGDRDVPQLEYRPQNDLGRP